MIQKKAKATLLIADKRKFEGQEGSHTLVERVVEQVHERVTWGKVASVVGVQPTETSCSDLLPAQVQGIWADFIGCFGAGLATCSLRVLTLSVTQ